MASTSVDSMFRAGQISSKEWARLHPNEHGKGGKTTGKMVDFDSATKDEGGRSQKGHKAGSSRHINHKQTMGTAATAGGKPPYGGMASKGPSPTTRAIDEVQTPMFPSGAGKTGKAVSGGTTNPSRPIYGGPPNRQRPQRI